MNIVLSNRNMQFIEYVLNYTDWTIVLLIVGYPNQLTSDLIHNPRIKNVISQEELYKLDDFSKIDISIIKSVKQVQPIGDYGTRRGIDDLQFSRYAFYNAISFFEKFFSENKINLCLIFEIFHGYTCDFLLAEIAQLHDVRCLMVADQSLALCSIFDKTNEEMIPLKFPAGVHAVSEQEMMRSANYYQGTFDVEEKKKDFSSFIKGVESVALFLGGTRLYMILRYIYSRLVGKEYYENFIPVSFPHFLFKGIETWRNYHYLEKFCCPPDIKEKFIVFFMHFEPEAALTHYADILDSQLVMIGMIAQALPKGWLLYVKIHPCIYEIWNNILYKQYIINGATFFTKYLVDKIRSFPSTKIISIKFPAKTLIEKSEAIASVCGTVTREAVILKKPVLCFANKKRYILGYIPETYFIESMDDLKRAISEIERCNVVEYKNYMAIFSKYLFPKNTDGYRTAIKTIKCVYAND